MSTTLILGGAGKVARHLTKILANAPYNHTVHSVIRNPAQVPELQALGPSGTVTPHVASIEDSTVSEMAELLKKLKPNAVVWSAGAGGGNPERTQKVDREGAIKAFDAAAAAGIQRFVMVSALDLRDRENKPAPSWYGPQDFERSNGVWTRITPYMEAKFAADKDLVTKNSQRGLKYTIVRPGGLTQDPSKGTVAAGKVPLNNQISREDVAKVIAAVLENDDTIGLAFDVVGGDTPIKDAVDKVANERIDTFDGHY